MAGIVLQHNNQPTITIPEGGTAESTQQLTLYCMFCQRKILLFISILCLWPQCFFVGCYIHGVNVEGSAVVRNIEAQRSWGYCNNIRKKCNFQIGFGRLQWDSYNSGF